jgi:hypothetical protein
MPNLKRMGAGQQLLRQVLSQSGLKAKPSPKPQKSKTPKLLKN